jgi:hypothetical protein
MVGASQKLKSASEAFVVNHSIFDRRSETETEDIMIWDGTRAWGPEKLIE